MLLAIVVCAGRLLTNKMMRKMNIMIEITCTYLDDIDVEEYDNYGDLIGDKAVDHEAVTNNDK